MFITFSATIAASEKTSNFFSANRKSKLAIAFHLDPNKNTVASTTSETAPTCQDCAVFQPLIY